MCVYTCVKEHLGYFHLLAIVDKGSANMSVQISLQDLLAVILGIDPKVELLDHIIILFFIFKEQAYYFPISFHHFLSV